MTQLTVLLVLVLLVVAAAAGSYYILKGLGRAPTAGIVPVTYFTPTPTPFGEVSDSDDPDVLEAELDSTTLDSIDADLNSLETSASSL